MRTTILLATFCWLAACGGGDDSPPTPPDPPGEGEPDAAPVGPDAYPSICGQPGDVGNELGVGKFCETLFDCNDTVDAPVCSNFGDATTFFCTRICQEGDPPAECGTGAECVCGNGGCGCTPTECLQ